jgi:hypothetical protein
MNLVQGQFMIWPEHGFEEDADLVEGETPIDAAETWMVDHHVALNEPDEQEVHVRDHEGKLTKLMVEVVQAFQAREIQ